MYLRFSLHKATAEKVSDNPLDPFNRESEIYQTWQIMDLEDLEASDDSTVKWARQGFSATGAPDDGVGFGRGASRVLEDPTIAFVLPELADGQTRNYRFDMHYWESDSSSEKVRAAFTDATLKVLIKALKDSHEDGAAAKRALETWLRDNSADLVSGALAAASITTASWVGVGLKLLPLLPLIVDVVKSNSDDYIGLHRFVLQLKKEAGQPLQWRISSPSGGVPNWQGPDTFVRIQEPIEEADGGNVLHTEYACYVLS
jgi:hypothetical protein